MDRGKVIGDKTTILMSWNDLIWIGYEVWICSAPQDADGEC